MQFIITVDTEADNQWNRPSTEVLENISGLPRFQCLCEKYGLPPTYLVTYEVAVDPKAIAILLDCQKKGAEIGAHLHPWTTPPFTRKQDEERIIHRFPHELEQKELRDKLRSLTDAITVSFGKPVSYRSGRWGFNRQVAEELVRQGYQVDCSVTPKISWRKTKGDPRGKGGPDYTQAPLLPYQYDDILLEVPLTVIATSGWGGEGSLLLRVYNLLPDGLVKRVVNRLGVQIKTLRLFPETTTKDLVAIINSAKRNDLGVLEFMIHSSELWPGTSVYTKTERDVEKNYLRLAELFTLVREERMIGVTLAEFAQTFKSKWNSHDKTSY